MPMRMNHHAEAKKALRKIFRKEVGPQKLLVLGC